VDHFYSTPALTRSPLPLQVVEELIPQMSLGAALLILVMLNFFMFTQDLAQSWGWQMEG